MGMVYKYYKLVWKTAIEETFKSLGRNKKTLVISFCSLVIGSILYFWVAGWGKLKEELLTYIAFIIAPFILIYLVFLIIQIIRKPAILYWKQKEQLEAKELEIVGGFGYSRIFNNDKEAGLVIRNKYDNPLENRYVSLRKIAYNPMPNYRGWDEKNITPIELRFHSENEVISQGGVDLIPLGQTINNKQKLCLVTQAHLPVMQEGEGVYRLILTLGGQIDNKPVSIEYQCYMWFIAGREILIANHIPPFILEYFKNKAQNGEFKPSNISSS